MQSTNTAAVEVPGHVPAELVWPHRLNEFAAELDDPFDQVRRIDPGPVAELPPVGRRDHRLTVRLEEEPAVDLPEPTVATHRSRPRVHRESVVLVDQHLAHLWSGRFRLWHRG